MMASQLIKHSLMCRSCLSMDREMINLFSKSKDGFNLTYMDCFNLCTSLKFSRNDDNFMPKTICRDCLRDLRVAFSFRSKCQKSDYELRSRFKKAIKYEHLDAQHDDAQLGIIMDGNMDTIETEAIEIEYHVPNAINRTIEEQCNSSNVSF